MGIIKADGYGHGSVKMAEVLLENGVASFGVATLEEAITLREAGVSSEIVVLGLTPDLFAETIVEYDLTPVTCTSENAAAFSREGEKAGKIFEKNFERPPTVYLESGTPVGVLVLNVKDR